MPTPSSFAFRTGELTPFMTLDSLGWQTVSTDEYSFDGESRPDQGHIIFQYTLSGEGKLDLGGKVYSLTEGKAFLVTVPSLHRYYYEGSSCGGVPWEFLWLNVKGEDAVRLWSRVIDQEGPVITLAPTSEPLSRYWQLYEAVSEEQQRDKFALSALVYEFILTFMKPEAGRLADSQTNRIVRTAKHYLSENYAGPVTLDELADCCGVTKYHLCRLFQRFEYCSPMDYLRMRRIEAAIVLLRGSELPIQEIGQLCGFESNSYFGKVFREQVGLSPREYRNQKLAFPFDAIYFE